MVARVERVDVRVELVNQEDMVYVVSFVDLLPRVKRAKRRERSRPAKGGHSPCGQRY